MPPLPPQVIKRTGVQMQQRQMQAAAVAGWQAKIEGLEPQVEWIVAEEREERALRKAEMEAQKVGRCAACCAHPWDSSCAPVRGQPARAAGWPRPPPRRCSRRGGAPTGCAASEWSSP